MRATIRALYLRLSDYIRRNRRRAAPALAALFILNLALFSYLTVRLIRKYRSGSLFCGGGGSCSPASRPRVKLPELPQIRY